MNRVVALLLAAASVVQASGYSVPFSAGTADFSVATINEQVSVVCAGTVAVTCQAVRMENFNQSTLGVPKTIDMYHEYLDIEVISPDNSSVIVCYATGDVGLKCTQLRVDNNFGLMGEPFNEAVVCANNAVDQLDVCTGLSVALTDDFRVSRELAVCYEMNGEHGACSMVTFGATVSVERRLLLEESWSLSGTSLVKVPQGGPFVLCVVTQDFNTVDDTEVTSGNCRTLHPTTLQVIPGKKPLELGKISIVSATYVGKTTKDNRDRLTVCYHSTDSLSLYCGAMFLLDGGLFVSSRSAFVAKYEGLLGLRVFPLSNHESNLVAMGCLATMEEGPQELICSLISTSNAGVITVDQNEMVVNKNGFYFQNVPQALRSVADVGAYLEPSQQMFSRAIAGDEEATAAPTASSKSDSPYIADVTVLPDFANVFPAARGAVSMASEMVSSVGCINMGIHDMDSARFCVGTASRLDRPPTPLPPFPPADYCAVSKLWECEARNEHCAMVAGVCTSKYACSTQKTPTGCSSLISQGGQCKFENGACVPTYEWDPKTMCQTVSRSSLCNGSPDCVWAANACRPKPYCQLSNAKQCRASPGCVWLSRRCGVSSTAL